MKTQINLRGVRFLLATLLVTLIALSASRAETAFSKIVVFGDSFNDHGNMVQFTGGVFPNAATGYAYGRQSNGPVWVEYLARRLGMANQLVNYAVVGAMTKPAPGFPTGNVWSDTFPGLEGTDVATQVLDYLADAGGAADRNALYILEGGANDFPRVADPAVIISNLVGALMTLEARGARHILLVNLPDIGKTPRVILGEMFQVLPVGFAGYLSAVCTQLNQALVAVVATVSSPDATITLANLDGFMDIVTANPSDYGLVEVQMPYLLFGASADPATWLFWDDLHPTTRGHEIFAEQALSDMIDSYSRTNGSGKVKSSFKTIRDVLKGKIPTE